MYQKVLVHRYVRVAVENTYINKKAYHPLVDRIPQYPIGEGVYGWVKGGSMCGVRSNH